jgi:hypothetical protein
MRPIRAAAAAAALILAAPSGAELMIAPTRVVLAPAQRSAELVLVNKGADTAAFRISVENRRMRRDGGLEAAETPRADELFAADKIRFSPRQLILEPGARQTIRIAADVPPGLAPGEYRTHLRLMSAPTGSAPSTGDAAADPRSLSIQLIAIRSLTIPVLLRVGTLDAEVSVADAAFAADTENLLVVRMTRQGARSSYGDLRLTVEGEAEPAYFVRGVAIYTPNTERDVLLPLPAAVRTRLAGRAVRIEYVSTDPAAPGVIAAATARL